MIPETPGIIVQTRRPDEDVLDDIEAALWKEPGLRSLDWTSLSIAVHDGRISLEGHVSNALRRGQIESIAAGIPGVTTVHNAIVTDRGLAAEVARALAADARTRPHPLRVGAFHGWVHLSGAVPEEISRAAEEVAAGVPCVRGILEAPRATSHPKMREKRRPLQPGLGAPVYCTDGLAGKVSEVVISPHSRLVTHVAVLARFEVGGERVQGEYVIPIELVELVSTSGVFLEETLETLAGLPPFDERNFPSAPADWTPPFPYRPGSVRWPRRHG